MISLTAVLLGAAACTQRFEPDASTKARGEDVQPVSPRLAPGWRLVDTAKVNGHTAQKLGAAKKAAKTLGATLFRTLTEAVGERQDYARGVEVCQQAAPNIAATVATDFDLEVGRTSFRVRNPNNRPQAWAQPIVEQRYNKPLFMAGPHGDYVFMAPIKLAEVCVSCHGAPEQIPVEVRNKLAERYPEDEAVGFVAGGLRGWIWVRSRPSE